MSEIQKRDTHWECKNCLPPDDIRSCHFDGGFTSTKPILCQHNVMTPDWTLKEGRLVVKKTETP